MHASMAGRFVLTHDVSDLCIGKPPLRWLPPSATVADAMAELDGGGPDAAVAVWDGDAKGAGVLGRVRMADVVLFLYGENGGDVNLASPAAALQATLADLLAAAGAPSVRRIDPHASVLEAVDALLGGAQCLVVPIRDNRRREESIMCWLTVEDVVRFFLGSVALFSPTASRSVSDLGVVRPARALAVSTGDCAASAVRALRAAMSSHASVAVVSGSRRLEGEISASTLCSLDAPVAAAAFAALSAGELAAFVDCGRSPRESALRAVLPRRNILGMLHLLDGGPDDPPSPASPFSPSSSSSSCSSFSSSSEDDDEAPPCSTRQQSRHGSWSARWSKGRRSAKVPVACRPGSSLVAVMAQAVTHRVTQVWVVDDNDELVGVVGFLDVLRVLRRHLVHTPPSSRTNNQIGSQQSRAE